MDVILHDISRDMWRQYSLLVMFWEEWRLNCNTLLSLEMKSDAVYDLSINLFKPHVKQNIVTLDSFKPWLFSYFIQHVMGNVANVCTLLNYPTSAVPVLLECWVNFSSGGPPAGDRPELQPKQINNPWPSAQLNIEKKPVIKKAWVTPWSINNSQLPASKNPWISNITHHVLK